MACKILYLPLMIVVTLLAGASGACQPVRDSLLQPPLAADTRQFEILRYKLLMLYLTPLDCLLPPSYSDGARLFAEATDDYEAGYYRQAAEGFWRAARFFRCDKDAPGCETLTTNRLAAYKNAVWAWEMAECRLEARRILAEAVRTDPACAGELDEMAATLAE